MFIKEKVFNMEKVVHDYLIEEVLEKTRATNWELGILMKFVMDVEKLKNSQRIEDKGRDLYEWYASLQIVALRKLKKIYFVSKRNFIFKEV